MSRKVIIYSTKTNATQEIMTDVSTWGELKPLINPEMNVANAKCTVRETRNTLENNNAQLPTGTFTVFVYPTKMKSGTEARTDDVYANMTDAQLRKACQRKSLVSNGPGHVMRSKLRAYDKRHGFTDHIKAHLSVKKGTKPTTIKKKSSTTTGAIRGAGSPTTAKREEKVMHPITPENAMKPVEMPDYAKEAEQLENDFMPNQQALVANSDVNIREVVMVMRNKFLNMFDELLSDIDTGDITRDVEVLNMEAQNIAAEMGFTIE
jgi:hypothetical protein